MRILVWGLGYVGTISAACLAKLGHEVIGIEPNRDKVEAINAGSCAVVEPGLKELVSEAVTAGRLRAALEGSSHVPWADVSLICIGTPSAADGNPRLDVLQKVTSTIARALSESQRYHVAVVRSTVFPGTVRDVVRPLLEEHSGRKVGPDFGLVVNPEFLREGTGIEDFFNPPYTVIGEWDSRSGDLIESLYRQIDAPIVRTKPEEAEVLKLVNNAFHAVKIGFANEVGRLCDRLDINSQTVMDLVSADTKLNISPVYLRPGFAFGGSCLPKDLRSLSFNARRLALELPILDAILPSNRLQIEAVRIKIQKLDVRRVAVLGLSFKPGTDDLRESPMIDLIQSLWRDGVDVLVYDPDVHPERIVGANRAYLDRQLPQLDQVLCSDVTAALRNCEAVIVTQKRTEFGAALRSLDRKIAVVDLVRLYENPSS